ARQMVIEQHRVVLALRQLGQALLAAADNVEGHVRCGASEVRSGQVGVDRVVLGVQDTQHVAHGSSRVAAANGGSLVSSQYILIVLATSANARKSTGLTI